MDQIGLMTQLGRSLAKKRKCIVIGDGVIGLTTAIVAAKRGWNVRIYTDSIGNKMSEHAVSPNSCALWYPALVGGSQDDLDRWSNISFEYFMQQADLVGVKAVTNYELIDCEAEWRNPESSIKELPNFEAYRHSNVPDGVFGAWKFETFIIAMDFYLAHLRKEANEVGVDFQTGARIKDLNGVAKLFKVDAIFNCTGIEGPKLSADNESIHGVKGHLIFFPPQETNLSIGRKDYAIMPRNDYITVGALFLESYSSFEPEIKDRRKILDEVNSWVESSALDLNLDFDFAEENILFERAGIRPYRKPGVRLELWYTELGETIIDNYGHGGSGVTICWGCAEDAVSLADNV